MNCVTFQLAALALALGGMAASLTGKRSDEESRSPGSNTTSSERRQAPIQVSNNAASAASGFKLLDPEPLPGGGWRILWNSESGKEYVLQRWNGDDLSRTLSPAWIDVARTTAEGAISAADDLAVGRTQRYYRVVQLEGRSPSANVIRIFNSPEQTAAGWRITWTATPGRSYTLQRWTTDELSVIGAPIWTDVATVIATASLASALDESVSLTGRRFYRVIVSEPAGDTLPPSISAIQATPTSTRQGVVLRVTATDDDQLREVVFFDGTVQLGAASSTSLNRYELTVPVDSARAVTSYFVAKAIDASGNEMFSPVLAYVAQTETNRFAVLDPGGKPTGEFVQPAPDGTLPAFEYRPAGRNALGADRELSITFSEGARLVVVDGKEFIEFTEAEAKFGPDSPIQFLPVDSAFRLAGERGGPAIKLAQAEPKRLPVGAVTMQELADAFGYDPQLGIPITFFGKFPMLWKGGVLEDYGISTPQFSFLDERLPLPTVSGSYDHHRLNLLDSRAIQLPFYGEFTISDGSATPLRVAVPATRPLWVTMSPHGELSVDGRVEVTFGTGATFAAELTLDEPLYRFTIAARSVEIPKVIEFDETLPETVSGNVSITLDPAQLNSASAQLKGLSDSLREFNDSALASLPYSVLADQVLPLVPAQNRFEKSKVEVGVDSSDLANEFAASVAWIEDADATVGPPDRATLYAALTDGAAVAAAIAGDATAGNQVPPALSQALATIAARHFALVTEAIDSAQNSGDLGGFLLALDELLTLAELADAPYLDGTAGFDSVPSRSELSTYGERLTSLASDLIAAGEPIRSLPRQTALLRSLLSVLQRSPDNWSVDASVFVPLLERVGLEITAFMGTLNSNHGIAALHDMLEAGLIKAALEQTLNLPSNAWTTTELPAMIHRITEVARQQAAFSQLHDIADALLRRADDLAAIGDVQLRKAYLDQIGTLLDASRRIAADRVVEVRSLHETLPDLVTLDFQLPGGITVHGVSGSADYNRATRQFSATFTGDLAFPEFDARLAILNGTLSSGGEFEIQAHGQIQFPTENPIGTASIPEGDPLLVRYSQNHGLQVAGGAAFEFENGMFFRGSIGLLDPLYHFSMEAGGLKFDLLDSISFEIPALPNLNAISEDGIGLFNLMLASFAIDPAQTEQDPIQPAAIPSVVAPAGRSSPPLFSGANAADPLKALEAWGNYLAVSRMLGRPIDPAQSYDIINRLIDASGKSLDKELAEFERLGGQVNNIQALTTARPRRALQIDFGSDEHPYSGEGPGHDLGILSANETVWNAVDGDRGAGFMWADGSPAEGVSIDLGRQTTSGGIDWSARVSSTGFFGIIEELPEGVTAETFDGFPLFRDGMASFVETFTNELSALTVRLSGLAPGYFAVVPIAFNSVINYGDYIIWVGRTGSDGNRIHRAPSIIATTDHFQIWSERIHYTAGAAALFEASDDLLVISQPGPRHRGYSGRLQGLQLVEVLPEIQSFTANPVEIGPGNASKLSWNTAFATSVRIDSGVGAVDLNGSRYVTPAHTTKYTLTAANPSGAVSASVVVNVLTAERQFVKVTEGLAAMNATYKQVAEHLDAVAKDMLLGKDAFIDLDRIQARLDSNAEIYRKLISQENELAHQDKKVVDQLVRAGLDLAASYALTATDENLSVTDVTAFLDRVVKGFEIRVGLDPQSGQVDPAKVRSKSAADSMQSIRDLLGYTSTLATMGSDKRVPEELILEHAANAQEKLLNEIEYDAATGNVNVTGKSEQQTTELLKQLSDIDETRAIFNQPSTIPPEVYAQLGTQLQDGAIERLKVTGPSFWQLRFVSLKNLVRGNELRAKAGLQPRYLAEIRWDSLNLATQINAQASASARLSDTELDALAFLERFINEPAVRTDFSGRIEKSLRSVDTLVSRAWRAGDLKHGIPVLRELVELHIRLRRIDPNGELLTIANELQPEQLLARVGERFVAAARAAKDNQQLVEFSREALATQNRLKLEILPDNSASSVARAFAPNTDPVISALKLIAHSATATASDLARDFMQFLERGGSTVRPIDLQLPGDLVVDRVFGHLFYNRETGFIQGGFGGRLEFPEIAASFEISDATVANDGTFRFAGSTDTPLPFGNVRVTATIAGSGSIAGPVSISGDGQMVIIGENGDQTFQVDVGYDAAARRLQFDTRTIDTLLRFTDDFVLFDAGLGFEVSTSNPSGELVVVGTAGLMAKNKPLGATASTNDFHLHVRNASVSSALDQSGFEISLDRGTLHLPDLFKLALCDGSTIAEGGGPTIALDPENPIRVRYTAAPERVTFAGNLLFRNLGAQIAELDGLKVGVCSADLMFREDALPRLRNVNGTLEIPVGNEQLILHVSGGEWGLDGFPTGLIQLGGDLALISTNGFLLSMLGGGQQGCPPTALAISKTTEGAPVIQLVGGLKLAVPANLITSADGGALNVLGCGTVIVRPESAPQFQIDRFEIEGDFRLASAEGFELRGARLVVEHPESLFGANNAGEPFRLSVTGGRLQLPNGAFFAINSGEFSTDGSFLINAEAGSGSALQFSGAKIEAAIVASRSASGVIAISGSGQLELTETGERFNVSVSYDQAAARLAFDSQAQNLHLRFSDDFVLFDAGFGFEVVGAGQSGRMEVRGSAGLAAKAKPLPANLTPGLFQLVVDDTVASIAFDADGFQLSLTQGQLRLPELFETALCPVSPASAPLFDPTAHASTTDSNPSILLSPATPLFVRYHPAENRVTFGGEIEFRDIGFAVPGIADMAVAVCTAKLTFSNNTLPVLSNVNGSIQIPLPHQPAIVDLLNSEWRLDGLPTGTIVLRNDLELLNAGGFRFALLGTNNQLCPDGTALKISSTNGQPQFRLDGGIQFSVPANMVSDSAGGELFTTFCAGVDFGSQRPPLLEVQSLTIGAEGTDLRLGGPNGLVLKGGRLSAQGIQNLFNQSEETPFVVVLTGGFEIPNGPGFALRDAQFEFVGEPLPRFSIGGAEVSAGDSFEVAEGLPIQVTEAGFTFIDRNLPLPQLLAPDNLVINVSASMNLPPEEPIISGKVHDLVVRLVNGVPQMQVSGIGLGIENFEIPPLTLTGQVYIGGLGPGEDIYFAGNVGGTLQGAGVQALLAFNLRGPLGCCFSVNAGPAGIPLGQTGILFTGAEGGVSFLNTNGDPCDFRTFINVDDATGRPAQSSAQALAANTADPLSLASGSQPAQRTRIGEMHVMTWEEFREARERYRLYREADAAARLVTSSQNVATAPPNDPPPYLPETTQAERSAPSIELLAANDAPAFPCPTGDCPPETVNILCQPHPDFDRFPNRIIVKFSSIDERTLNQLGITREFLESLGLTTAAEIANEIASRLRGAVEAVTPRPDPTFTGPNGEPLGAQFNALLDEVLGNVESAFKSSMQAAIQGALGGSENVYGAIVEAAYAGVSCPDATIKLAGTFSHLAVSSFLSGTGGVVLSSTGSAGLVGSLNLFGVPVGFLDGFVNATDANGDPNPSMCGFVEAAIGPLELGKLKALFECEGCVTGVLTGFADLAGCLSQSVVDAIVPKVAPRLLGQSAANALNAMTDAEKLAFLGELFSLPPTPGTADCFLNLVISSLGSINPEFTLCGAVEPKLFGFPLSGSAIEVAAAANKTSMAGQFSFSSALLMGSFGPFFPIGDKASFGFGVAWPNPDDLIIGGLSGRFNDPAAFARYVEESFAYALENSTYTIGFELSPFGLKGFQSGARVLMPNLTRHPEINGWIPPEARGQSLPSRLELMLAAVENGVLANPLWKGTAADIHLAFAPEDPRRQRVSGLTFANDYFPHGGVIGAARVGLPKAITDSPPDVLGTVINPDTDIFERLSAALDYVQNYILQTTEVGTLGFYVPAPNPPVFVDATGAPLKPKQLLDSIMRFDPAAIGTTDIYPLEYAFLQGHIDGQLLGIPIARARVEATPPSSDRQGRFSIASEIPEASWMKSFVDSASMVFELRQPPQRSIEQRFTEIRAQLEQLISSNATSEAVSEFIRQFEESLFADLPKVALDMSVNDFRIPNELGPILSLDGSATARFVAYSPRYEPGFPGDGPLALARKNGGVALQAKLRFADLITIENAELAVFAGRVSPVTGLPALAGRFDIPLLPVGPNINLRNALLEFNSEPAVGAPYLAGSGNLDPVRINPLLEIVPLVPDQSRLGGELRVLRPAPGALPSIALSIEPARISMPIFAEGLSVEIHGTDSGLPFTFATEGPWNATVSLKGGLVLRDLAQTPVLRIGSPQQRFTAAISGDGLASATIALEFPTSIEVTAFPGSNVERAFTIGSQQGANARLVISSDGTFELSGGLQGALALSGLPIQQLNAGAAVRLTQSSLTLTGSVSGGSLDGVNTGSASATIVMSPAGIAFNGAASIPPMQFGVFRISGLNNGNLEAVLDNESLRIPSGARLAIQGIASEALALQEFVVAANGNFAVGVASSDVIVPDYFRLSGGTSRISKSGDDVRFEMIAPRLTVFPGAEFQTTAPTVLEQLLIESSGRLYYDSGDQTIGLPLAFTATGRLEFGYEPDANAPGLSIQTSPIQFGLIDTGKSGSRTLRAANGGGSQLQLAIATSDSAVFGVTPAFVSLAPGEAVDLQLRFTPNAAGTIDGTLTLTHNTSTSPTLISLTGQGRAVPVYYHSANTIDFGEQPAGAGALRQFFVANIGKAPLQISSPPLDEPFNVSPSDATIAPGESVRLFVTFQPQSVGSFEQTLTVSANDETGTHPIVVRGSGSQLRWWTQRDIGGTLRSVDGAHAVGDNGALLRMDFDGDRWTPEPSLGNIRLNRVYRNPNGFGSTYAVGNSGVVLRLDAGQWKPIADPVVSFGGNRYLGVATYWPSHLLMLVGERGLMVREHSFGAFSKPVSGTLEDLYDVAFNGNASFGIAVGTDGTILRSSSQGGTWSAVPLPSGLNGVNLTLRAVDINANGISLIVGNFGTILRSATGGLNWQRIANVPTDRALHDVRIVGNAAYAVGDDGVFLKSNDGGLTWQAEGTTAATRDLFGLTVRDSKIWVVGQSGFVAHRPVDPPVGPRITRSTGLLDFGSAPVGGTKKKTVTIYNRGTEPLEIRSIEGNSNFSANQTAMTIEPGGQRLLAVYFHPSGPLDSAPGQPNGILTFRTNDRSDGPDGLEYLALRGVARETAWRQIATGTTGHLTKVQFVNENTGYAIFSEGIIKTTDGGATWNQLPGASPPGTVRAMHFLNAQTGLIGGGDGGSPFIRRTINGGQTWTSATLDPEIEGPVVEISVAPGEDSRGYAVTASFNAGQLNRQGVVIRTLNGGASWSPTPANRPAASFSGTAVYSYNPFRLYAASGGALYRSVNSGSSWEEIFNAGGAFPIQTIRTVGLFNGFVGGLNGLFRRTAQANATDPVWSAPAIFTSGTIRDVHFVTQDRGWCVAGGTDSGGVSTIFRTEDGGVTWKEEFSINDGTIQSVWGVGSGVNLAYAVGTNGRVWKYEAFGETPSGWLATASYRFLGEAEPGQSVQTTLELHNRGTANLRLDQAVLSSPGDTEPFTVGEFSARSIAPGASATLPVTFRADSPGTYRGVLTVTADGREAAVTIDVEARVIAVPQLVVIDTEPSGLRVTVDNQTFTTPVAFTVTGDAAAPNAWLPESVHSVSLPDEQTLTGVLYRFQSWDPTRTQTFELTAPSTSSETFIARHVPTVDPSAPTPASLRVRTGSTLRSVQVAAHARRGLRPFSAANATAAISPPSDLPAGPWLRLSNARLTIPALGDLDVQGAAFLSANQMHLTLDSSRVRLPQSTAEPELLEVTAGSWRLDYTDLGAGAVVMALRANTPGVELFNVPAVPPSQLVFSFEPGGHFEATFATFGTTPVLPGLFEIGPSGIRIKRDPLLTLEVNGELRVLKMPDGNWAVQQPLQFDATEGPFTYDIRPLPNPLLNLGFLMVDSNANSSVQIRREAGGAFGVALNNLNLTLLGRSFANFSGNADTSGLFQFTASPPASPFVLGPMRYDVSSDTTVHWSLKDGEIYVGVPAGKLKASGVPGWPESGIDFPGFTLNSRGNFERKINLPTFSFDGITMTSGGNRTENYLLFKRNAGVVSVKVRDQRDFFGNDFRLAMDIASSGSISGSFSGTFSVDTPVFGRLDFGSVALQFDPSADPYQFQGRFPLIGNDFGIFFGSGGGKFNHLICDGPGLDNCEEGFFSLAFP